MKLTSQKYTKKEYANQTVNFAVVGVKQFDADGNIEIEDEFVDQFITLTNDSFAFTPLNKKDNKNITAETVRVEVEDLELRALLDASGIKELAEMAHEVGLETQDIANMTDAKLRVVLYNKIKVLEASQPKLSISNSADNLHANVKSAGKTRGRKKGSKNKPAPVAE